MRGELHYTLTHPDGADTEFGIEECSLEARYNIAPGQPAPVCRIRDGARVCDVLRWGLLPRWRGHGGARGPLVHAVPVEAVPGTPLLREAFAKQRCLVIADGCFAWRELKQPIWFHPEPRRPIAFAGVWNVNDDDGTPSFAILLGPPLVTRVRDLMPIVLCSETYETWLDPSAKPEVASEVLVSSHLDSWRADAVSTRMRSTSHDDPACVEPVGNPAQGELF